MRFKEFSGEWERYNCYDILVNFSTNSLSWDKLSYNSKTQIYNLHYGLIHNGAPTLIDCSMYQLPNIIEVNTKKQEPIINGDVIFTDASEDTNDIGKAVEFINIDNKTIFAGLHTIHVREKLNLTIIGFKGYLFHSRNFHKQVERITQGSKVYSLNFNNFKELYVNIPNHKEQQKIANFLSLIDKRIETQIKIIEEYKSLIKGIREKIFKEYNGKSIKLKDILIEFNEKNLKNDLQPVAIGKYGIRKRSEIYSKELSHDLSKNKIITKDTLVIGMGTKQIDIGILLENAKYCVSPAYATYKISNINSFYLNELLININALLSKRYMIISARQGKSVNKTELLQHNIIVHNNDDQEIIIKVFSCLYKAIKLEINLLNCFKAEKKYLLDNLFI